MSGPIAAASFAGRNWKLIAGGLAFAALLVWSLIQHGNARHWEKVAAQRSAEIERGKREAAEQLAANEKRLAQAVADYAAHAIAREPIIIRSRDTVREYAQTDAGRSTCLAPDRVRGIDALDAALDDPGRPGGGESAVRDHAGPAPERR